VFSPGHIAIQWVRQFQPTFSGAMIARIEATISDTEEKQRLAQPSPMTDAPADFVVGAVPAMENERNWLRHAELILLVIVVPRVTGRDFSFDGDSEKSAIVKRFTLDPITGCRQIDLLHHVNLSANGNRDAAGFALHFSLRDSHYYAALTTDTETLCRFRPITMTS
jgi:hypothetical protein